MSTSSAEEDITTIRRSSLSLSNGNNGGRLMDNNGGEAGEGEEVMEDPQSSAEEDNKRSLLSNGNEQDSSVTEDVQFDETNGKDGFALRADTKQVRVYPSEQLSGDASPFHFNTIVDYTWETQYSHGRLIATHISSLFIAYVVKVGNTGAVRVIDMQSKERVLMKGEKGLIKDVDFLHRLDDIILGFIDEYGTFHINKIIKENDTGKLTAHPIIKVTLDGSPVRMENRRFIWCKYVPDELKEVASPKDCAYHFAVLQNDTIYAGNLVQLVQNQGEGPHQFHEIREEFLPIDTHSAAVTDASFAPDGTALATCSKDGTVKFFQIYFQERAPARCLYSWAPHDGRPIDKICFLDNHTLSKDNVSESQYWKYMITAADNCTELKLFTCKSWECLQTLKLITPSLSQWKLELNITGHYLMATDIHRKAMHLLHLDCTEARARFDWIQEFAMPWNTIGFNISCASRLQFADAVGKGFGPAIMGDLGSYKETDVLNLVEINVVQPRSMQQGSVALKSPRVFGRRSSSSNNGTRSPRRISFNPSIDSVFIQKTKTNNNNKTSPKPTNVNNVPLLVDNNMTGGVMHDGQDDQDSHHQQETPLAATASTTSVFQQPLKQHQFVNKTSEQEYEQMAKVTHSQMLRIQELEQQVKQSQSQFSRLDELEQQAKLTQSQFNRIEQMLERISDVENKSSSSHSSTQAISQTTAELLASNIGAVVQKELGSLVLSAVSQVFDPSRLNVTSQIDRLTNVVEAKLAQNINQIMQRDRIWQTLTNNFQAITKNVFDSTFNDIFMNSVFPRCQTAVQEMLSQVNDTFRNGTREYLTGLESVLETERRRENIQELMTQQISSMQDALSSALQVEIEAQMLRVLGGIQGGVVRQIEDSMTRELNRSFQEQQRFLEVSAVQRNLTPAVSVCESLGGQPISDARANKRRVMEMARNGDVRGAFTLASSLGDADILMQLCKTYNATVLPDLNLPSSVHLSIMQLLASDILEDTEVKIDYLNMSIMCLDMGDAKSVKGVTRLIPVYQAAVNKFEDRNPNTTLLPRIKVLQMAFGKAPQQLKASSSQSSMGSHSFSQFQ